MNKEYTTLFPCFINTLTTRTTTINYCVSLKGKKKKRLRVMMTPSQPLEPAVPEAWYIKYL